MGQRSPENSKNCPCQEMLISCAHVYFLTLSLQLHFPLLPCRPFSRPLLPSFSPFTMSLPLPLPFSLPLHLPLPLPHPLSPSRVLSFSLAQFTGSEAGAQFVQAAMCKCWCCTRANSDQTKCINKICALPLSSTTPPSSSSASSSIETAEVGEGDGQVAQV